MSVCVCEKERESESACVCVCVRGTGSHHSGGNGPSEITARLQIRLVYCKYIRASSVCLSRDSVPLPGLN